MIKIWQLLLVIGLGVATFLLGTNFPSDKVNLLSTAVLVSTLGSLIWYTFETRGLRLQQQFDSEVRNHPWLKGSALKIDKDEESTALIGREIIYLPITNVGVTPAHDLKVVISWQVTGSYPLNKSNKAESLHLAPGDTHHIRLCEIEFDAPEDRAKINVEISYTSFAGGGGRFTMNFYSHEKGWANGPMSPYEFWLSDGRRFPLEPAVKAS